MRYRLSLLLPVPMRASYKVALAGGLLVDQSCRWVQWRNRAFWVRRMPEFTVG